MEDLEIPQKLIVETRVTFSDGPYKGKGTIKIVFPKDRTAMIMCDGCHRTRFIYLDQLTLLVEVNNQINPTLPTNNG